MAIGDIKTSLDQTISAMSRTDFNTGAGVGAVTISSGSGSASGAPATSIPGWVWWAVGVVVVAVGAFFAFRAA